MHSSKDIFADLRAGKLSRAEAMALLSSAEADAPKREMITGPDTARPTGDTTIPIAIIGKSGRYPDAPDLGTYWQNLAAGKDAVRGIPPERWDAEALYDPRRGTPGKIYSRWLGALEEVDCFDPLFFQISPAEASYIDPQHRIMLQEAYRTFEDAGYAPEQLSGRECGVYMGIMSNEYAMMLAQDKAEIINSTGNAFSIAAGRIAYWLNLKGPAVAIDTACSSSLVALHLGCQALRTREVEMALVCGVSLYLTAESYIAMCGAGMLASDGACKAFDNRADGFVPGEGAGAVLLKRLDAAERDGDRILGTIIASGINQDGKTNGITAPNGGSQEALVRSVYRRYGIDPRTVSYCEMHGTGTKLGDPVELEALSAVYGSAGVTAGGCAIGSVKSNIGHASAAAGVASLHKVLLSIENQTLAPSLHFKSPNEHFNFNASPFRVVTSSETWEQGENKPRRAAISSFGLSGTNAHVVVEEYRTPLPKNHESEADVLLVLSAQTAEGLRDYAQSLRKQLLMTSSDTLADLAYTLQIGRAPMPYRLAIVAGNVGDFSGALESFIDDCTDQLIRTGFVKNAKAATAEEYSLNDGSSASWKRLAESWVGGIDIDWQSVHAAIGRTRKRVAAPTYPFAKKKFWLPGRPVLTHDCMLIGKQWELAPLENDTPASGAAGPVLILVAGGCENSLAVAEALVSVLAQTEVLDVESAYQPDDIPQVEGIIDLSGWATVAVSTMRWLAILQALVARKPKRLIGVSRGIETGGIDTVRVQSALQSGLYRALAGEYPSIMSSQVDLPADGDTHSLAGTIVHEYYAGSVDIHCRYCEGKRYRAVFGVLQRDIPALSTEPFAKDIFDHDDAVWITGGTRGLGLLCAQHLVSRYGIRKLFLSGKTQLPPRSDWEALSKRDAAFAERINGILELEAKGVRVELSAVALNDPHAVSEELVRVKASFGAITGLLHCAGVTDWSEPAFFAKTPESMKAVLMPKTTAFSVIIDALAEQPLKRVVLFSSVAVAIPSLGAGQVDYAMANAFLDYFASSHVGRIPVVSVQWPSWNSAGMGSVHSQAYLDSGLQTLSNAEGLAFLDWILACMPAPIVLPAKTIAGEAPWERWLVRQAPKECAVPDTVTPHVVKPPDEPLGDDITEQVQRWLLVTFSRELKLLESALDVDTPFQDYGVDSIMLTQLLRPLNQWAETPLDPSLLFVHGSIARLTEWLIDNQRKLVQQVLEQQNNTGFGGTPRNVKMSRISLEALRSSEAKESTSLIRVARGNGPCDVAVIGLACRFPGAPSVVDYWDLLRAGQRSITPVPASRWGYRSAYKAGLIDIDKFAPDFFGIDLADARAMDPQALLLLELCLELFHHSGYSSTEIKGKRIGVFLGGRSQHIPDSDLLASARYPVTAVGQNYLAANLSHHFDLRGASLLVDTACSSSLVAMHLAVLALQAGEIEAAVVGGISLLNSDGGHRLFQQRGILASGEQFHVFDSRAGGIVLGEGAGLVMLKPLAAAQADGDRILAVLKGLSINNDGRSAGPASPNFAAQQSVLQDALAQSGLMPTDVQHVEANGSGTMVTDLIELKSIEAVYGSSDSTPQMSCALGSVKPNIGHTLCAEGIAAFIKSVLMVHHRQVVPFLSGQQPMEHFKMEGTRFVFVRGIGPLKGELPAVALNCFGDGGTNAHAVLQAWDESSLQIRGELEVPALNRRKLNESKASVAGIWPRYVAG